MSLLNSDVIPASATTFEIEQSLRFNDNDSAYLSWTPSSAGNRKTATLSYWVKRGNLSGGTQQNHFFFGEGTNSRGVVGFNDDDTILIGINYSGSSWYTYYSTAKYRDTSAWYHIVVSYDLTNSTASDRVKFYVNGVEGSFTTTPSWLNSDTALSTTVLHTLGSNTSVGNKTDGYLAEVNFIDGQALDPSYFGETGDYGEWKPIEYTGTYGTNGFYLPFKNDYQVEGFSTTTWGGDGASSRYIGGVGFQPDFIWGKARSRIGNHYLMDAVRGSGTGTLNVLNADDTSTEQTNTSGGSTSFGVYTSFDSDGFTVANGSSSNVNVNNSGDNYVAWSWDMGGSNATNTDGSITSTVRANPTYGQSIVSYVGNQTQGATVGHGLSSAPELIIIKNRDLVSSWAIYHTSLGANNYLRFDTAGTYSSSTRYPSVPSSTVFTIGNDSSINGDTANDDLVAYCFHSVSGYSKFGSYTGSGSGGNSITTGFKPAFVMVKRTDTAGYDWRIHDSTRLNDGADKFLRANTSAIEGSNPTLMSFSSTGFSLDDTNANYNASGGSYIYIAFADTREFAYWLDQSGNNNDWTSNNLTESDISVDSPTNNFATLNAIDSASSSTGTLSEGNLLVAGADYIRRKATFYFGNGGISSGKWYWEIQNINGSRCNYCGVIGNLIEDGGENLFGTDKSWVRTDLGYKNYTSSSSISLGLSHTSGDILGFALDMDAGTLAFYQNNSLIHTDSTIDTNVLLVPFVTTTFDGAGGTAWSDNIFNFGQESSFAGTKTAQGNTDANEIGDFYYTPPSGYLALCTANLPDPTVIPSEHFNTVLWTGDGSSSNSITGVGFNPDLVWTKGRNVARHHWWFDKVRGVEKWLQSSNTDPEADVNAGLMSFDTDGFTYKYQLDNGFNTSGDNYVSWNWKANGSGSSNTNGSITSTVSANQDAGFSIFTYTGNGTGGATIGHGLTQAPEMVIIKPRSFADNWNVYHKGNTTEPATEIIYLNLTNATSDNNTMWNDTVPTSTVITLGSNNGQNQSGETFVGYAFHSVDGFSKVGSYTGNGSADGTFVYTGFRPAFIMVKSTTSAHDWVMEDNTRSIYNPVNEYVIANSSQTESSDLYNHTDFLSNGFKLRDTQNGMNGSNTYIYIAFAENPFKYTNAR